MRSFSYARAKEKQVEIWSMKALPRGLERQLGRYLLHKCEDQSLDHQHTYKSHAGMSAF